jgi:hypothetical protein
LKRSYERFVGNPEGILKSDFTGRGTLRGSWPIPSLVSGTSCRVLVASPEFPWVRS